MKRPGSTFNRSLKQLQVVAAILAVIGQLGISGVSLTLAREETSAIAHTEQSGTNLHHGHNEASCAVCAALSFNTTVTPATQPIPSAELVATALERATASVPAGPQLLPNSCRAPPREA
jgi:hypothetical protein